MKHKRTIFVELEKEKLTRAQKRRYRVWCPQCADEVEVSITPEMETERPSLLSESAAEPDVLAYAELGAAPEEEASAAFDPGFLAAVEAQIAAKVVECLHHPPATDSRS
jgi:hypothetical protein